jgi:hypothetical protein
MEAQTVETDIEKIAARIAFLPNREAWAETVQVVRRLEPLGPELTVVRDRIWDERCAIRDAALASALGELVRCRPHARARAREY